MRCRGSSSFAAINVVQTAKQASTDSLSHPHHSKGSVQESCKDDAMCAGGEGAGAQASSGGSCQGRQAEPGEAQHAGSGGQAHSGLAI